MLQARTIAGRDEALVLKDVLSDGDPSAEDAYAQTHEDQEDHPE